MDMDYASKVNLVLEELAILEDHLLRSVKYNASAQKARVQSIRFSKMLKAFRKDSVKYFKDKLANKKSK